MARPRWNLVQERYVMAEDDWVLKHNITTGEYEYCPPDGGLAYNIVEQRYEMAPKNAVHRYNIVAGRYEMGAPDWGHRYNVPGGGYEIAPPRKRVEWSPPPSPFGAGRSKAEGGSAPERPSYQPDPVRPRPSPNPPSPEPTFKPDVFDQIDRYLDVDPVLSALWHADSDHEELPETPEPSAGTSHRDRPMAIFWVLVLIGCFTAGAWLPVVFGAG